MKLNLSRKGQITILDLVLVPIVAVTLSIISVAFLQGSVASIVNTVNQAPTAQSCNFALDSLYGNYYVDTPAALAALSLQHPDQYETAISSQSSALSASCGSSCSLGYNILSNSLTNFTSLYSDFINYFSSFSVNGFKVIESENALTLKTLGLQVYLNQIPSAATGATVCSLAVFNPTDPSNPYTVFGVLS